MGRRYPYLWRQHSYIQLEQSEYPGCIWGILRLINYHQHWRNVKKILPTKKHRRSNNNKEKRKASNLLKGVNEEGHDSIDEGNPVRVILVNPPETGSISKRSIKVRIRELLTAKDKNSKCRVSYLPEQTEIQTTQIVDDEGNKVESSTKDKSAEEEDVLEIFKVNKHMFLKMLNDQNSNIVRLTKSGSFPCVNSTRMREWGPRKLEDKQREIWPITKSKGKVKMMRRASSLTESMDRYSQLFGSAPSFNKDIKKHLSRSLKIVMNENDEPSPKFRRRLSLPECDYESLVSIEALKSSNEEVNNFESAINEEISDINQGEYTAQVAIELPISEDYETPKTDETSPLIDEKQDQEFYYVKLVLELSGFISREQTWVWYTMEHPLNPTIFNEIEKEHYPLEGTGEQKQGRKLIFDLINEALVEIDERSYLYCPRALSSKCYVHPIPKGQRLLEEVWLFVRRSISWRPEFDPTLDLAVAQDLLLGRNGWMNLQIESECVALEVEEMILDELLDELLLACS